MGITNKKSPKLEIQEKTASFVNVIFVKGGPNEKI